MQAHGTDRVRIAADGRVILSCRVPKEGWQARIDKTLTTPEHPGTAIDWENEHWEIVAFETTPAGVRYTLAPWPDYAAMRFVDRYDEASETARAKERQRAFARERGRKAATLAGFLTGHLPAGVQRALASELGINPSRLTMVSAVPPFIAFIACMLLMTGNLLRAAGAEAGRPVAIPGIVVLVLLYMGAESVFRFLFVFMRGAPIGSLFGLIGYAAFYALAKDKSKLVSPVAVERGSSIRIAELSAQDKLQSDLTLVEPLFTLLDERDQELVASRYGVNYRSTASTLAAILLVFSMLGIFTSFGSARQLHLSGFISIAVAGFLFAEQVWRFTRLQNGPAPSVLRFVVRPFVTKYLR